MSVIVISGGASSVIIPSGSGTAGPAGPPGSGSTIGVNHNGVAVSSTVQRINVTGDANVTGSGADITIDVDGTVGAKNEGSLLSSSVTAFDFTGAGVTATYASGTCTVDIDAGGGVAGIIDASTYGFVEGLASGAHAAANATAWAALKADLIAAAVNSDGANRRGLPQIQFPLGTYEFSAPLDLNFGTVVLSGHGFGTSGVGAQTRLKFYSCTGIRIQDYNTSGASTKDGTGHYAGSESVIRNIAIEGNYASGAEAEYHGIHMRATAYIENVHVTGFHGDGIRIEADVVGTLGGNANFWRITGGRSWGNRRGLYVDGADANGGSAHGLRTTINRQAGIYDSSLLGNAYLACETASNGILSVSDGVTVAATCVSHGGNLYQVVVGEDAGASTNAPSGTTADNQWWWYRQAGAPGPGGPAWTSGILVRAGGAVICDTPGAYNTFVNCYAEWDQPRMQAKNGTMVVGGSITDWVRQGKGSDDRIAVYSAGGTAGAVKMAPAAQVQSGAALVQLGASGNSGLAGSEYLFYASQPTYLANGFAMRIVGGVGVSIEVEGTAPIYFLTTYNTSWTFGRSTAPTVGVRMDPLFVGGAVNGREIGAGLTAAPASGPHAAGDFYFDASATTGKLGYMCRGGGTPGTYETYYCMIAAKSTGWAAATGTATRTTYDTATVTTAQLAERVKALIDDLTTRGVIGA
jgi:hypothetical protein